MQSRPRLPLALYLSFLPQFLAGRVRFQFGTQQRSDREFRWACELALNGRLGKLKHIEVGVPGGLETDLFGEEPVPAWVDWDRWVGPAPVLFANNARYAQGVRFVGENGWVHVRRGSITAENPALLEDRQNRCGTMPIALPVSVHHQRDLIEAIRSGKPTVAGIDTAVRSDTLCQLGLAAVRLERRLRWDPEAEVYVGDAEANRLLEPRPLRAPWRLPSQRGAAAIKPAGVRVPG